MEFLDISLTNDSIFSMLFIFPPTGGFWRKPYSSLVLKILTTKPGETRKLEVIHESHFVEWENEGRKLECEKTRVYAQKPQLNMPFKNSISRLESKKTRGYAQKPRLKMLFKNSVSGCWRSWSPWGESVGDIDVGGAPVHHIQLISHAADGHAGPVT